MNNASRANNVYHMSNILTNVLVLNIVGGNLIVLGMSSGVAGVIGNIVVINSIMLSVHGGTGHTWGERARSLFSFQIFENHDGTTTPRVLTRGPLSLGSTMRQRVLGK